MKDDSVACGLSRRDFVRSATAAGVLAALPAAADEKPLLKVGLISDTHLTPAASSADRVRMAFRLFREKGVDAIAHVGDLADWHYPEAYAHYRKSIDDVFPAGSPRPELLYAFGDHDALDPRAQTDPKVPRRGDLMAAWLDMKERLGITHGYHDVRVLAGCPFLIFPQTFAGDITFEKYEKIVEETCRAYPDRPVFVLEHAPSLNTTYNSHFESPQRRSCLNRHPQVVEISGHKHASVFNEACIWQGEFTSLQVSCLQLWYGLNVGERVKGKHSFGASVLEVYPDRVVVRRYDVADGSEFRPDAPWRFPVPYRPGADAPYAPAARAKAERPARFPAGAKISVTPDGAFSNVTVSFPSALEVEDVFSYRVEISRKDAGGGWERFAVQDAFGEFYLRPTLRKGTVSCAFCSSVFESDSDYLLSVTPMGVFGCRGVPLTCEWHSGAKAPATVIWACDDPMSRPIARGNVEPKKVDGWYQLDRGWFKIPIPEGIVQGRKGDRFRFTAEIRCDVGGRPVGAVYSIAGRTGAPSWSNGVLTPKDDAGLQRYVLEETCKGSTAGWAFKFSANSLDAPRPVRLRVERLLIERIPLVAQSGI